MAVSRVLPRIIDLRTVHDRWSTFSDARFQLPNGVIERRVIEDHGDAASVLLYDPSRRVALLVEQPRAPVLHATGNAALIEAVAGRLDGKSPEDTAKAEAFEEAGVVVGELEHVATVWTMPAVSTERMHLYLAPYDPQDRTSSGGGAVNENECIIVREMSLKRLWQMLESAELTDGKTVTLLQALRLRYPELFEPFTPEG